MHKQRYGIALVVIIATAATVGLLTQHPIPQNPDYHLFRDTRTIGGIPNFWNVVSNLPFLLVGTLGILRLHPSGRLKVITPAKTAYFTFFLSIGGVALGSGYYHLWPSNQTLFWDRLPIAMASMALFSIVISEFISVRLGKALLWPLLLCGILSVAYWLYTETMGHGDLRYYALVQFLPMLLIPVIMLFFRSSFSHVSAYWWLLLAYTAAKLFEHYDGPVYESLVFINGHSLKHLSAAMGLYVLLCGYEKRYEMANTDR